MLPFLNLSRELRNMVYTETIFTNSISYEVYLPESENAAIWSLQASAPTTCLLQVSRQVRQELNHEVSFLLAKHKFWFHFSISAPASRFAYLPPPNVPINNIRACEIVVPVHVPRTKLEVEMECCNVLRLMHNMPNLAMLKSNSIILAGG
jgi:hypothetical protein